MKKQKGITLIALVITIIVMLILVAVSVNIATNGGIFENARKAAFQADVAKYKEELQAFLVANYKDEDVSKEIQEGKYCNYNNKDTEDGRDLTECIPSYNKNKYKKSFVVEENKLKYVYEGNNKEAEWVKEYGLEIQYTYPKVTINIDGEGTVKVTGEIKDSPESKETKTEIECTEETEFTATAYKKYELTATGVKKNINGNNIEFVFSRWLKDGETISTNATETITVTGAATYTAVFEPSETLIYYNENDVFVTAETTINESTYSGTITDKTTIKKVLCGNKVTAIGNSAFKDCTGITKINLNNVTSLGGYSFRNCTNLEEVIAPKIKTVGLSSFYNCNKLKNIQLGSIGNPVESIGQETFWGNSSTSTVKIYIDTQGGNVTSLAGETWSASTVEYYDASTGECVNIILGSKYVGNTDITWEQIPNKDKITQINGNVFSGCTNITGEITIPDKVINNKNAMSFQGCTGITKINLNNVTSLGGYSFRNCTNLEEVIAPKIKTVGLSSFYNCNKLKNVQLGSVGNPVESIGQETFWGISSTSTVKIYIDTQGGTVTGLSGETWYAPTVEYYDAKTGDKIN